MLLKSLVFAVLPMLSLTVQAAEMPKEGTDSFTNTWVLQSPSNVQLGDKSFTTYQLVGVSHHGEGSLFGDAAMRCVGSTEATGKQRADFGVCTVTDKDGDEIIYSYDGKYEAGAGGPHGAVNLAGGSGKFAGISGTGEWATTAFFGNAPDKIFRAEVAHKITWKLQ